MTRDQLAAGSTGACRVHSKVQIPASWGDSKFWRIRSLKHWVTGHQYCSSHMYCIGLAQHCDTVPQLQPQFLPFSGRTSTKSQSERNGGLRIHVYSLTLPVESTILALGLKWTSFTYWDQILVLNKLDDFALTCKPASVENSWGCCALKQVGKGHNHYGIILIGMTA